jgi:hypothetical protein
MKQCGAAHPHRKCEVIFPLALSCVAVRISRLDGGWRHSLSGCCGPSSHPARHWEALSYGPPTTTRSKSSGLRVEEVAHRRCALHITGQGRQKVRHRLLGAVGTAHRRDQVAEARFQIAQRGVGCCGGRIGRRRVAAIGCRKLLDEALQIAGRIRPRCAGRPCHRARCAGAALIRSARGARCSRALGMHRSHQTLDERLHGLRRIGVGRLARGAR